MTVTIQRTFRTAEDWWGRTILAEAAYNFTLSDTGCKQEAMRAFLRELEKR